MPAAAAGRSRLQTPSLAYANKQPNFAERIKTLRVVADNLLATAHLLSTIAQEVAADAIAGPPLHTGAPQAKARPTRCPHTRPALHDAHAAR